MFLFILRPIVSNPSSIETMTFYRAYIHWSVTSRDMNAGCERSQRGVSSGSTLSTSFINLNTQPIQLLATCRIQQWIDVGYMPTAHSRAQVTYSPRHHSEHFVKTINSLIFAIIPRHCFFSCFAIVVLEVTFTWATIISFYANSNSTQQHQLVIVVAIVAVTQSAATSDVTKFTFTFHSVPTPQTFQHIRHSVNVLNAFLSNANCWEVKTYY